MKIYSTIFILFIITIQIGAQTIISNQNWCTDESYAKNFPKKIYQLDLSNRSLTKVPQYVSRLVNLRAIKLNDNYITEIGDEFKDLKYLDFVELSGNSIAQVNFEAFHASSEILSELYLRDNYISTIGTSINKLSNLTVLNIGNNNINEISNEISLTKLVTLYLDNNHIKNQVSFIQNCPNIRRLNINANQMSSFSLTSHSRKLRILDIGDNPLREIAFDNTNFRLEKLFLDWVDFNVLNIYGLPQNIIKLSLEHCQLSAIPFELTRLKKLRQLSVMHNQINYPESQLLLMKNLKKLWIYNNPLSPKSHDFLEELKKTKVFKDKRLL